MWRANGLARAERFAGAERGEGCRDVRAVSIARSLNSPRADGKFLAMAERTLQLVLHYDGGEFAGWQVQPERRTVQGVLEDALAQFCGGPVRVTGAGRTDAGVHARGQVAGITVAERWDAERLRRVLNDKLPRDIWVAAATEMRPDFHARYSASTRRYSSAASAML